MNRKIEKAVLLFAAFSLSACLTGGLQTVLADATPNPGATPNPSLAASVQRNLTVDFLGRGDNPKIDIGSDKLPLTSSDAESKTQFWVGLAVDKVDDLDLFKDGVYSVEVAFEYDPNYLELSSTWENDVKDNNFTASATSLDQSMWNENDYNLIIEDAAIIDTENDREDALLAQNRKSAGWRMCTVCISYKDGSGGEKRFANLTSQDKHYLVKLPFKIKKVPAADAADPDPVVLSFVRGPETFDIASNAIGTEPHASWEASPTDWTDQTNLRNLFKYGGDILLFGNGATITDISVLKYEDPSVTPDPSAPTPDPSATPSPTVGPYKLSQTTLLEEEGYDEDKDTYYVSVPNDTAKIKIAINSSGPPTVKANSNNITVQAKDEKKYQTLEFDLDEMTAGQKDEYKNIVTVELGGKTYTINIQRRLKPKIELEYGNSPYAMLERMGEKYVAGGLTEAQVAEAKQEFNNGPNKFSSNYLPEGMTTSIRYTPEAWVGSYKKNAGLPVDDEIKEKIEDPEINLDRNLYAIFAYERETFYDTGFIATDSWGVDVSDKVTRVAYIKRIENFNRNYDVSAQVPEEIKFDPDSGNNISALAAGITKPGNTTVSLVRPGVYELKYSFETDDETFEGVSRKIIILPNIGDVNMQDGVMMSDTIPVIAEAKNPSGSPIMNPSTAGDIANLFIYRVADTNMQDGITMADTISIIKEAKMGAAGKMTNFYKLTTNN